ncbi:hypothetical protein ABPG73_014175 [Tetrahymena malaccensis]
MKQIKEITSTPIEMNPPTIVFFSFSLLPIENQKGRAKISNFFSEDAVKDSDIITQIKFLRIIILEKVNVNKQAFEKVSFLEYKQIYWIVQKQQNNKQITFTQLNQN